MVFAFNPLPDDNFNPQFKSGELVNSYEMMMLDLIELCLGDRFRYFAEYPLEKICHRTGWIDDKETWQFLVSSHVDIAVMKKGLGSDRKAALVIECQSWYHDDPHAQERDNRKVQLLKTVGVPLIYIRQVAQDHRYYRFYTPDGTAEIFYNLVTQENRGELEAFLLRHCG
ncbi:MAG: DUF2726 domain-containing protein [Leptolyngbyaceae bacterium]|nr:DUF2726 domain-containing protein [Leptolyngbyaceae bacterium]